MMDGFGYNETFDGEERKVEGGQREEFGEQTEFLSLLWIIFMSVGLFTAIAFVWQWNKRMKLRMEVEMEEELESAIATKAILEVAMERRLRLHRMSRIEALSHATDQNYHPNSDATHKVSSSQDLGPFETSLPRVQFIPSEENNLYEQELKDRLLCVVCRAEEKNTVLEPCRHLCLCQSCSSTLFRETIGTEKACCPLCRTPVQGIFLVHT